VTTEDKLKVLCRVAERFNRAGLTWAVGASLLLYFHGICDTFHDIDLMLAEPDVPKAREILDALGTGHARLPSAQYQTAYFLEYTIDNVDFDVIAGFAIVCGGVCRRYPLDPAQITGRTVCRGTEIPLHSLSAWLEYYRQMGRTEKVQMLTRYFQSGEGAVQ
jgi:hypothetical protein